LYLAKSTDKCKTFTDSTVFDGEKQDGENTVQFGDIFNDLAIDGAGNLYVVGAGYIGQTPFAKAANIYEFSSRDAGQHWSAPSEVGASDAAHMLPAAVGGPGAGQLAIGYFRTVNGITDPNATTGRWTYATAESQDAAATAPSFSFSDAQPGAIDHNGDICNQGILCGSQPGGPSDRSLLDFTSAAVDTHGCPVFTFAANPTGSAGNNTSSNTFNFVTRQLTGCFHAASTGGPGSPGRGTGTGSARRGCPAATGSLHGKRLGLAVLGMTRRRIRHVYRRSSDRGRRYEDFFCLTPVGVRVGYASPKLLATLSPHARHQVRGRVIWASSSNRRYALRGIRSRARLRAARQRLHLSRGFRVGRNVWYFAAVGSGPATSLLKVRHGTIEEVGIVERALARNPRAQRILVRSFY
jgi:hypothetical protein